MALFSFPTPLAGNDSPNLVGVNALQKARDLFGRRFCGREATSP
jgi:hypothetical protein